MSQAQGSQSPARRSLVAGLLAEYQGPGDLLHAAERIRDAGYTKWDCHTPFPVHGLDPAMGLKPTPLGFISLVGGIAGGSFGLWMQWWMNGVDYPLNIGGKPPFAVQAFVPVTFELTILLTAFATLFGMLGLNRLPQLYHWTFHSRRFERVTDNRFFLSVDADDPKFDASATGKLLEQTHPLSLEVVEEAEPTSVRPGVLEGASLTFEALTGVSAPFADRSTPSSSPPSSQGGGAPPSVNS